MRLIVDVPLRANGADVWAALSTIGGTNRELAPFVRMTDPTHGTPFDADAWQGPTHVTWQLLFGVIPIDRHRIELVALPDGRGFRESSSTWWYRVWRHERAVLDDAGDPGGCVVRDSVDIEPRLRVFDPIVGWAVRWTFRQRHRHLRRRFG